MKHTLALMGMTSLLLVPAIAIAEEDNKGLDLPGDFSATMSMTTDYTFRGVTQNNEEPAIQGSIDWSNDLGNGVGVYLGTWASNVDFNDGDEANSEFDVYGGLTYGLDKWSFDVGAVYYAYPGAASNLNYDYWEAQATAGYDFDVVALAASVYYSPEFFGESGDAQYYKLAADAPLPYEFSLSTHIGRQEVDDNTVFGLPDYTDWSIGIGYTIEGFDLALQYIDTSLDKGDCSDGCDARAVFTVSRTF